MPGTPTGRTRYRWMRRPRSSGWSDGGLMRRSSSPTPAVVRPAAPGRRGPRSSGGCPDAWLLFDFHGLNPVAKNVLKLGGMGTRRIFVFLPKEGEPVAVAHKIELTPLEGFPGKVVPYARWQELQEALTPLVKGKKLAMEVSPKDAVPYLDRVPHGVVQMLEGLGGIIVPSGELVSRFAARWSA